jgi:glutamine synthetase
MPKPFEADFGSAAHFNMSLCEVGTDKNLFIDANDPRGNGFSSIAYSFIAGILQHGPAITAISAPLVNSYKRFVPQGLMSYMTWAPVFMTYGANNRSAMLRIARSRPALENRVPDISCNVYLASALHLAAGLEGIAEGLDPGEPVNDNLYQVSAEELKRRSIPRIPRTLLEAVDAFEADPIVDNVLGSKLKREWIELKTSEWNEYHQIVTDIEHQHYKNEIQN